MSVKKVVSIIVSKILLGELSLEELEKMVKEKLEEEEKKYAA